MTTFRPAQFTWQSWIPVSVRIVVRYWSRQPVICSSDRTTVYSQWFSIALRTAVRHVTNAGYFLPNPSSTFHGRDIFAPVAAALAQGVRPEELGPVIQDPVRFGFAECDSLMDGSLIGRVIHIDHFGNCVTNFAWKQFQPLLTARSFCLRIKEYEIHQLARTYSEATLPAGEPFAIIGSAGFLEISLRSSSAAREFKITVGDPVKLTVSGS